MAYLEEFLVAQLPVVSAMLSPLDKQDMVSSLDKQEATLASHHPAPTPLMGLRTSVPRKGMEAQVLSSEAQADSPVSDSDKGHQTVFPDQLLELGALTSAQETDLHLPAPGQERVPEAMALAHQAHRELSVVL